MQRNNWQCVKFGHQEFETGQFAATGGGVSKFFNVKNKKFATVSCTRCRYTEIYKTDTSTVSKVLDFLSD